MVKYFHKCPYCGKNMTFTHTKESKGNIYYVFKCPHCGADGEILLDFVSDYIVRCKKCKKSTWAAMNLIEAIEDWNNGELNCIVVDDDGFPQGTVEFSAAVKTGLSFFVLCDLIFFTCYSKLAAAKTVCILTDDVAGVCA